MKCRVFIVAVVTVFLLSSLAFPHDQAKEEPVVLGHYDKVYSKILEEERTLLVGLPDGYTDAAEVYPVLYLLDGDIASFGEALSFIRSRGGSRVPDMIVVAIKNTKRNRDLIPGSGSEQAHRFLKFMTDELFEHIQTRYRAAPYRILFGGSNAGLFAVYALLENRRAFSAYLVSSPTFVHRYDYIVHKIEDAATERFQNQFLSIIYGDHNAGPEVRESIQTMIPRLERLVSVGLRLRTRDFPEEGHVPFGSLPFGLMLLFEGYEYPREKRIKEGLDEARAYYDRLSEKIGFTVEVPLSVTATIAMLELAERKNYKKAIEAFESAVRMTPRDVGMNCFLALAYFRDGDLEKARSAYFKVKELSPQGFPSPEFEEMKKFFEKSAAKIFLEKRNLSGTEAALAWLADLDPAKDPGFVFDEKEFIAVGKEMRSFGFVEEAVRFLKETTEFFPSSSAVWETLGFTHVRLLQKEEAVRCYQKAIELDPKNKSAEGQLRMIDLLLDDTRNETRAKMKYRPGETTGLTGEYLGQKPPGSTPELFAPGIVSVFGSNENTLTMTPDGKEVYFGKESGIWVCRLTENGWTAPENTGFPGYEMWISPKTGRMFYTGYEAGIWIMERSGAGWGKPQRLIAQGMFSTMTDDETLYTTVFGDKGKANVGRYVKKDGAYSVAEVLGPEINSPNGFDAHPNVAPDGRFLVFDSSRPEGTGLYVSFKNGDGTWSPARYLGDEFKGSLSTFSPDGKYLFFMKNRDIYWVSARVIEEHRPSSDHGPIHEKGIASSTKNQSGKSFLKSLAAPGESSSGLIDRQRAKTSRHASPDFFIPRSKR